MKMLIKIINPLLCMLLAGMFLLSAELSAQDNAYRLGPGDVIEVQVFGEDDLSGDLRLSETGVINYAFVGEFEIAGRTVAEVERLLDQTLRGDYLVDPRIRVSVAEYRPFFIKGEVKSPGSYAYQPGLTISRAITLAGGLTERASERKIFLVPEGGLESQRLRVNLDGPVSPGDSITVEQSFF